MSNNDNNIEKRSFEAFINAIGFDQELGLYVSVRTLISIGHITEFRRNRCEINKSQCAENHRCNPKPEQCAIYAKASCANSII